MTNRFKERLLANERQIGLWLSMASPVAADALSRLGYDWLVCDTEHAPLEVSSTLPILQAADGRCEIVVRAAWNDRTLLKRHLDLGAKTLLVPFVETALEARSAVSACRYPPRGVRGVAGAVRASGYGTVAGYHADAHEELCLLVQVETGTALERLEEIASVEGVDGVFIGPSDLAASLGHLMDPGHDEVQRAIEDAAARLADAGTASGVLAVTAEEAERYAAWGFGFIAAGVDLGLLMGGARERLERMSQRVRAIEQEPS